MTPASKLTVILFAFFILVSFASCDQNTRSTTSENPDSMFVKKMSADSNSTMPVHTPKDSTAKIPNAYDSSKK